MAYFGEYSGSNVFSFFLNRIRFRGIFFVLRLFKGKEDYFTNCLLGGGFFLKVIKSVLGYFSFVFIPGPDPYRKCGSGSRRLLTVGPAPDPGCNCRLTVPVPVSYSPVSIRRFNVVSLILILIVLLMFFIFILGFKAF